MLATAGGHSNMRIGGSADHRIPHVPAAQVCETLTGLYT